MLQSVSTTDTTYEIIGDSHCKLRKRIKEELKPILHWMKVMMLKKCFDLESEGYNSSESESSGDYNDEKEFEFDDYLNEYLEDDPACTKWKVMTLWMKKKGACLFVENTFHELLEKQLGLLDLNDEEYLIAKHIIGSIDEDGYLRKNQSTCQRYFLRTSYRLI